MWQYDYVSVIRSWNLWHTNALQQIVCSETTVGEQSKAAREGNRTRGSDIGRRSMQLVFKSILLIRITKPWEPELQSGNRNPHVEIWKLNDLDSICRRLIHRARHLKRRYTLDFGCKRSNLESGVWFRSDEHRGCVQKRTLNSLLHRHQLHGHLNIATL